MRFFLWPFHHKQPPLSVWERVPSVYRDTGGRRYRNDVPYLLPKDDREVHRLDYQHFIFRQVLQGNTFAPVDGLLQRGGRVLDVGCGTSRWGYEIATTYPHTQITGFDLEPVASTASTPLNYQFYQGNLLDGLPFGAQQFVYTHQRLLVAGIPLDKWPFVVGELKRVTAAGGWLELIEMGTAFHQTLLLTSHFDL